MSKLQLLRDWRKLNIEGVLHPSIIDQYEQLLLEATIEQANRGEDLLTGKIEVGLVMRKNNEVHE